MKHVLITGGAGFIGSNLAEKLIKTGWDVTLLDIEKNPKNISKFEDKVNYIGMDVRNPRIGEVLRKMEPDGIVHLAAMSRVVWCEENSKECRSINVDGTQNVLRATSNLKDKPWLIFSSSREVYGNQNEFPVKETYGRSPISTYAETKCNGEDIVQEYADKTGIPSIILRFSNVYGNERDIPDRVIPKFIKKALQGEKLTVYGRDKFFDFTFIQDAISGILNAMDRLENEYPNEVETYNICTGKPTKLQDIPHMISEITNSDVEVVYKDSKDYDVRGYYGDCSKAKKNLGFIPKWDILEGLKYTIERYRRFLEA